MKTRIPLRPQVGLLLWIIVGALVLGFELGSMALAEGRPEGRVLAALGGSLLAATAVGAALVLVRSRGLPSEIMIDESRVRIPGAIFSRLDTIQIDEIERAFIDQSNARGSYSCRLDLYVRGAKVVHVRSVLVGDDAIDELAVALRERGVVVTANVLEDPPDIGM
jgi:hypothetical protein